MNNCSSYGKGFAFLEDFHQAVISVLRLELKSVIKGSGMYAVNGIYHPTQKAVTKSVPFCYLSYVNKELSQAQVCKVECMPKKLLKLKEANWKRLQCFDDRAEATCELE